MIERDLFITDGRRVQKLPANLAAIDQFVCQLYDLPPEEIALVEQATTVPVANTSVAAAGDEPP